MLDLKISKTFVTLVATFFISISSVVLADWRKEIDLAIPGKEGGNGWVLANMVNEALTEQGYKINLHTLGTCYNLEKFVNRRDNAIPLVYLATEGQTVEHAAMGCKTTVPNEESWFMPLFVRLFTMCMRAENYPGTPEAALASKDNFTVAASTTFPEKWFEALGRSTGKTFTKVTYSGSGSAFRGMLGGDTDLYYAGLTKREVSNSKAVCFTTSADQDIDGMVPMNQLFPDWKYAELRTHYFPYVVGFTAEQKEIFQADLIQMLKNDESWKSYIETSKMIPGYKVLDVTFEDFINSLNASK